MRITIAVRWAQYIAITFAIPQDGKCQRRTLRDHVLSIASVQGKKVWKASESRFTTIMKDSRCYRKTVFITFCTLLLTASRCMASEENWTVVTLARNGSWGVASASSQPAAIAAAITSCRIMAGATSDCGAQLRAARGEWIIANLCGTHKIIATGRSLSEAEGEALNFEISLQLVYAPDLPPCKRVVTVDSNGSVVRPDQQYSAVSGD